MNPPHLRLYYDFVDPLSWLLAEEVAALGDDAGPIEWVSFELRPPPTPLVTADDASLAARWDRARVGMRTRPEGARREFSPPLLVPWTRKAHELVLHAGTHGAAAPVRGSLFQAYLFEGRDIGRVDVLVELAVAAGLDRSEAKAVLDVDRFEADVAALRADAVAAGVAEPPALSRGDRHLEGFHNRAAIRTFLGT
jgi:predicted DsbA family dithiol-disulfide isomerase